MIPFCIISTRSSGDLVRELKEDPRGRGQSYCSLQEASWSDGDVNFMWSSEALCEPGGPNSGLAQRSAAAPAAPAARKPTVVAAAASIGTVVGAGVGL